MAEKLGTDASQAELGAARSDLQNTATEITQLTGHFGESTSGCCRPSDHAHVLAHQLIVDLTAAGFLWKASDVYLDQDEALRLTWNQDGRSLDIVFPFEMDDATYLYYSSETDFGIDPSPDVKQILSRLSWVFGEGQRPHNQQVA